MTDVIEVQGSSKLVQYFRLYVGNGDSGIQTDSYISSVDLRINIESYASSVEYEIYNEIWISRVGSLDSIESFAISSVESSLGHQELTSLTSLDAQFVFVCPIRQRPDNGQKVNDNGAML